MIDLYIVLYINSGGDNVNKYDSSAVSFIIANARRLIEQIEMANFKDENGFRLKDNVEYKKFVELIGGLEEDGAERLNELKVNRKKGIGHAPLYEIYLNGQKVKKVTDFKVVDGSNDITKVSLTIGIDRLNIEDFR